MLLLRFYSLYLFFDGVVVLTELPPSLNGIIHSTSDAIATQRVLILGLELFRLLIYVGTGVAFLIFTRPLAKFFTKGLGDDEHDDTA